MRPPHGAFPLQNSAPRMGHVRDRAAFRLKKLSEADHAQPQAEHQKKGESERDSPFSGTVYFSVNHRNVKYRKHHFYLEPQRFQAFFYALHCGFRMFSSCFHNHFTTFRILCQPHLCDTYLPPGDASVSKTLLIEIHVRFRLGFVTQL